MAAELIIGKVRGEGVIAGGTTGQGLLKKSGTDYDTEWRNVVLQVNNTYPNNGNVTIDTGVLALTYQNGTIKKTVGTSTTDVVTVDQIATDIGSVTDAQIDDLFAE